MRTMQCLAVLLALVALMAPARAEIGTETSAVKLIVELTDGSCLVGEPDIPSLPVQTDYARLEIALAQVRSVVLESDRELAVFQMANGDRIRGALLLKNLSLKTAFGDVTLGADHIVKMTVRGVPTRQEGLILWNTLGSEDEIRHSRVGPSGVFRGGGFTEGISGKAFVAGHDQNARVAFPKEAVPLAAGCIELWTRFDGIPAELRWGANPWLFALDDPEGGLALSFNGNDGVGKGGIIGGAGRLGACATGSFGSWTYARALDGGAPDAWHHYALVWDQDGIKGLADGQHTVAVYVDGKLNSKVWAAEPKPGTVARIPLTQGELALMLDQHLTQGRVLFDELKIWSHSRTDFADALRDRPVR